MQKQKRQNPSQILWIGFQNKEDEWRMEKPNHKLFDQTISFKSYNTLKNAKAPWRNVSKKMKKKKQLKQRETQKFKSRIRNLSSN